MSKKMAQGNATFVRDRLNTAVAEICRASSVLRIFKDPKHKDMRRALSRAHGEVARVTNSMNEVVQNFMDEDRDPTEDPELGKE